MSGTAVIYVGMDVREKFGDSRSNSFQDIRGADFMWNEQTYRSLSHKAYQTSVKVSDCQIEKALCR